MIGRLFKILRKKCTKCGNKCDYIKSLTFQGYIKEWCCPCVIKQHKHRLIFRCKKCTKREVNNK